MHVTTSFSMKKLFFTLTLFLFTNLLFSQVFYDPDGVRIPGDWNAWTNSNGMGGNFDLTKISTGTVRWQSTFQYTGTTGFQGFKFVSGGINPWGNEWRDQNFVVDSLMSMCWSGATCGSQNDSISVTNNKYYTVNFKHNDYTSTDAIFMETSSLPVTMTKVEQTLTTGITPADSVFVGVKLSANPSTEEKFYLRYTTNGFSTSILKEITIASDSGFTFIPAQGNGVTVNYYVFSTTLSNLGGDIDMKTINLINNGGSNYSYQSFQVPKIFITEIADPLNSAASRYVELYNDEDTTVNLGSGWKLGRYTNGNTSPQTPKALTGSIPSKGHYLICANTTTFNTTYGISADQNIGTGGPADSNGDDNIYLEAPNGSVVDFFGRPGEQGNSSNGHYFADGRAERDTAVSMPTDTFIATQWIIALNQNAPSDFDPGAWIGNPTTATPEPTNHVTGLSVDSISFTNATLTWIDADTGSQQPDGYLLIGASSANTLPTVVDATPIINDLDFSDGLYATNITHIGDTQSVVITGLDAATTYNFEMYSYTNFGNDIDYKTTTPPTLQANTPSLVYDTIHYEGFNNCSVNSFTTYDVLDASDVWTCNSSGYMDMNGFGGSDDEDWLISPFLPLSNYDSVVVGFATNERYDGADLELYFSSDYNGSAAPASANWKKINITFNDQSTSSSYSGWHNYGINDLDSLSGTSGYLAFKYTGTASSSENWQVDDFFVGGTFQADLTSPIVSSVYADTLTEIMVVFNEQVSSATATNTSNYSGVPTISSATLNTLGDSVKLNLSVALTRDDSLIVANIADVAGNVMAKTDTIPFVAHIYIPKTRLFFTELADPKNVYQARFIEIFNNEDTSVTLTGWKIRYYSNANTNFSNVSLTGTLTSKAIYTIASSSSDFLTQFGFSPNRSSVTINGNGNDNYQLVNPEGDVVDAFGVPGELGTSSNGHLFTDGRAERKSTVVKGKEIYDANQWTITTNQNAPADFDPNLWIGNLSATSFVLVTNVNVIDDKTIGIRYSKPVDQTSAETMANYAGLPNLTSATRAAALDSVTLSYATSINGNFDTLFIAGIIDTSAAQDTLVPYQEIIEFNGITDSLIITEIMYNNAGTDTIEFVELYNNNSTSVNLQGLAFADAFDFTFPNFVLSSGGYVAVAVDTAKFKKLFTVSNLFQWDNPSASGSLSNTSETISFINTNNQVIDSVRYDDGSPWDNRADGGGFSLALCNVNDDNTLAASWKISTTYVDSVTFASPGAVNSCPVPITYNLTYSPTNVCVGDSITLFSNASGGSDTITYDWGPSSNISSTIDNFANPKVRINSETTTFTLEITDGITIINETISVYAGNVKTTYLADTVCVGTGVLLADGSYAIQAGTYSNTLNSAAGCDSIIIHTVEVKESSFAVIQNASTPTIDTIFDGESVWGAPAAVADGVVGWQGVNTQNLYLLQDANFYYLASTAQVADWQSWAFIVNSKPGGGSADSWSRDITYTHNNLPDFVFRGNYNKTANYAEFHEWNGISWSGVGTQASSTTYGILSNGTIELKIAKASIGNPDNIEVQFYITGDQNSHASFDAIPDDQNATAWTNATTTLSHYARANRKITDLCSSSAVQTFNAYPAGGVWSGRGITNTTAGTYNGSGLTNQLDTISYSVTGGNGCSISFTDTISVIASPIANAGINVTLCSADLPLTLVASGGNSFTWNDGSTNDSLIYILTSDSIFIVEVLNGGSCIDFDTVMVTINNSPTVELGNTIEICLGDSAELNIAAASNTVLWSTTSTDTSLVVSPTTSTEYWVNIMTADNCVASDTIQVNVNALPTLTLPNDTAVCSGVIFGFTAASNGSVIWSTGNQALFSGNSLFTEDSTYYATASNVKNCTVQDSIQVVVSPNPVIQITGKGTIPYSEIDTIQATVLNGSGSYSYDWTPGALLNDSTTALVITVALTSISNFNLLVTDSSSNCSTPASYTTNISGGPLQINPQASPGAICLGDTTQLMANISGGSGTYSISWSPSTNLASTNTGNPQASPTQTTNYYVTVTDGIISLTDSIAVTINSNPSISFTVQDETYCFSQDGVIIPTVTGGLPPYNYSWLSMGNVDTIVGLFSGTYYLTVLDQNGCVDHDSESVASVGVYPRAIQSASNAICQGDSTLLFVNDQLGGTNYEWYTDTGQVNNAFDTTLWVFDNANYHVKIFNSCGTQYSDTVSISIIQNKLANVYDTICNGDSLLFNGSYYLMSGNYSSMTASIDGCDSTTTLNLVVKSAPSVTFIPFSTPPIDGVFEGNTDWNLLASSDGVAGWSGVNTGNLYFAEDSNYIYLANTSAISSWQSWAFAINTKSGGGSSDSWSRNITNTHNDLPDYVFRGNYSVSANYAEFHSWNGTSWANVGTQTLTTDYKINSSGFVEIRIIKSAISYSSSFGVQFYVTGDNNGHSTFDAVPNDQIATAWTSSPTTLSNFANHRQGVLHFDFCSTDTIQQLPGLPSGGTWGGTGILSGSLGAYNPALGGLVDTVTYQIVDAFGCSNSANIYIENHQNSSGSTQVAICNGDSIMLGGFHQFTAGSYLDTLTNSNGCDSILTTVLSIIPGKLDSVNIYICQGDSIMLGWVYRTIPGFYVDSFTTNQFCDSIVITNLSILTLDYDTAVMSVCQGDSAFLAGAWQSGAGLHTDTLGNVFGCDSLAITNLIILTPTITNLNQERCTGDSLFINGSWKHNSGVFYDTLSSIVGCDSFVVTNLIVSSQIVVNQSFDVCFGDSIQINGMYQNFAGAYTDTAISIFGCDSITNTQLLINPIKIDSTSISICSGQSYFVGGANQPVAGWYLDTLSTSNGCDSLVYCNLMVNPIFNDTTLIAICFGDSILLGGKHQITAGLYVDSMLSNSGCDSLRFTNLFVNPIKLLNDTAKICFGDSLFVGGSYQTTAGSYSDTYSTVLSCDSAVSTWLLIDAAQNVTLGSIMAVCADDTAFQITQGLPLGGYYIGNFVDSSGWFNVQGAGTGNFSVTYIVNNPSLCNNSASSMVTIDSLPAVLLPLIANICGNIDSIILNGGRPVGGVYSGYGVVDDSIFKSSLVVFGSHVITYTFVDGKGCSNKAMQTINVDTLPLVDIGPDSTGICDGASITLSAAAGFSSYQWNNGSSNASITVSQLGVYGVVVFDALGCSGSDVVVVKEFYSAALPLIAPSDTSICAGDTIMVSVTENFSTYLWNIGATAQTIEVTQANNYTVTVTNTNGCAGNSSSIVTFLPSSVCNVSVNETGTKNTAVNLYPNPTFNEVSIEILGVNGLTGLTITDMEGSVYYQSKIILEQINNTINLDVSTLASGVYFVRLSNNALVKVERLIVK